MGFDNATTLSGLFYICSRKDEKSGYLETVLSWNHFWGNALQQPSFTPFSHNNSNVFEFLEMFDLSDPAFYIHCKNNNMDLKLWEKKENSFKELLNIPISLNPFYDAFSDSKSIHQFHKEKMPITSFTDWVDVNVGPGVEPTLSAKIQVVLAIGTSDQLSSFKNSRNITVSPSTISKADNPTMKKSHPTALADMLSTFIDNLALSLPKRSETEPHHQYSTDSRYQLRRTSDLLDVLHNALKNPAPVNLKTTSSTLPFKVNAKVHNLPVVNHQKTLKKNIRVSINIDSARNIVLTSKLNTQDCYSNKSLDSSFKNDDKPCTYVSFEAIDCDMPEQYLNYATKIAQHSCNPYWNEQFNVMLPMESFHQNNMEFILKVWRKTSAKRSSHGSKHVDQDELIGFTVIDLSTLSAGTNISGYYNIVDTAGHVNGQIKIHIVPTDDIISQESNKILTEETKLPNNFRDLENVAYDVDNIILSRTLKRKFTELEEISQRLKSRLLDVTADESFEIDDEFENDLNTCPNEDDIENQDQFDWNRFSTLEIDCNSAEQETEMTNFRIKSEAGEDHVDILANSLKHSVLNNTSTGAKGLPADGNASMNFQTPE